MTEFLCLALSFFMFAALWKSRFNYLRLERLPLSLLNHPADVTVVIPARNEAHQIARVITSFPNCQVIVVDDASTDGTAQVALAAGAHVISAPALPSGAKGKPNACAAGARQVWTRWILFVDADTWFDSGFASSIVEFAQTRELQVVTAFLDQETETLAEKALLPYAFALYFAGVSAKGVNHASSRQALANGQCLLFERSAYEEIGGHLSVLNSVIEDVALARVAKQRGLRLRVIRAEQLGRVRMYDGLAAIWRGFQKNSFRFLHINPWSGLQVILTSIVLTSWLPGVVFGLADFPRPYQLSALLTPTPILLLFLAPFLTLLPWYMGSRPRHAWRVLLAPFAIYMFQLIALNGMLVTLARLKTDWKGRHV